MAGTGFTMNTSEFYKRTGKMLRHMRNTSKLTKSIGETLVSSTRERFRKEEDPEGKQVTTADFNQALDSFRNRPQGGGKINRLGGNQL